VPKVSSTVMFNSLVSGALLVGGGWFYGEGGGGDEQMGIPWK
jgi:hypothetical protein